MAQKKNKKRPRSRTVELKRQREQERLAGEKDRARKQMNPAARALLYGDLIFLALSSLLYANGLLSNFVSGLCTIIGAILLLIALWIQFRPRRKGPRL